LDTKRRRAIRLPKSVNAVLHAPHEWAACPDVRRAPAATASVHARGRRFKNLTDWTDQSD
jgi:hypothetical protein